MRNLLSANFARLRRDRFFWIIEAGIFLWSVFTHYMLKINIRNGYPFENANLYFFNEMTFIGITIACFCGLFIGTEYSDGTIRNKLVAGHGRQKIYLANLITIICAGLAQFAAYTLAVFTAGTLLVGDLVWGNLYRPVESLALAFLSICGSAAAAVLISMVIIDKPKAVMVNIFLSILILAAGASALKGLMQPEMTQRIYVPETGEYKYQSVENLTAESLLIAEEVPNPKYLRGTEREVYLCISSGLPTSQGLLCAIKEENSLSFSMRNVFGTLLMVSVLSGVGIVVFRRRDIK